MALSYNIENFTHNLVASHRLTTENKNKDFHLHNNYEIYLFLQGNVKYFVEQSVYTLKRGNLLIFNNKEVHGPTFSSNSVYERCVIHFSPELADVLSTSDTNLIECFKKRAIGTNNIATMNENQIYNFLNLINKLIDSQKTLNFGDDVLTKAYLSEILVITNKIYHKKDTFIYHSPVPDKLQQILYYINSNISSDFSLDLLGKVFSIDKYYLSRLFKKETGTTIYSYIILKKISLSKKLLSEGYSVTEVCTLSGFNDYSNFIRTFKKITGYSPANYNKTHK